MLIRRRIRPLTEDQWLSRMGSEFVALPGLRLTVGQARRLWGLEPQSCERLLSKLVRRGMLVLTPGGVYRRADQVSALHASRPHA